MDGLGRAIQTRVEAKINGQFRVTDVLFDERGIVFFTSLTYFSSVSAFTIRTGTHLGSYTDFDPIGRAYRSTPATQLTFDQYGNLSGAPTFTPGDTGSPIAAATVLCSDGSNPWGKLIVDSESKTNKAIYDTFGRVTQIVHVTSAGDINTYFKYD